MPSPPSFESWTDMRRVGQAEQQAVNPVPGLDLEALSKLRQCMASMQEDREKQAAREKKMNQLWMKLAKVLSLLVVLLLLFYIVTMRKQDVDVVNNRLAQLYSLYNELNAKAQLRTSSELLLQRVLGDVGLDDE